MSHKKQQKVSPENYIKNFSRNLPIDKCYINVNWQEIGLASIIVTRLHKTGKYTIGIFLVDIFALGTKDSAYKFHIDKNEVDEIVEKANEAEMIETDYVLVHNIIYGANAFAEDNGFKFCKDFNISQYILEEDTEDIELIDIEFGKDGEPFVIR
ncbi:MAG: hypothetical protein WC401_09320 [Bacteroidales bacterium]|jgi:hypothetical protein|nr:hypothetical protein [Bacteroidales bacterium]